MKNKILKEQTLARRILGSLILVLGVTLVAVLWSFMTPQPVNAQCGSQASSCKNCHEVQAKDPVNNDGTGWHQSHAFGDFCANCHAGNVQATDETAAHADMVAPLSDLNANCAACHPNDLQAKGEVYAKTLGVALTTGGATGGGDTQPPSDSGPTEEPPASSGGGNSEAVAPAIAAVVVNDPNVIDYGQRYLRETNFWMSLNWGDVLLVGLIIALLGGGGAFVYWNENRLRRDAARLITPPSTNPADYPAEILMLLPQLAKLNPNGRQALKRLLDNPAETSELLIGLSRIDPELVRKVRALDQNARIVLMGLSGD
jgi:hypothetical protein